ncbi:MAG TPA: metallophosphoesterase family protein [Polyangia bacterium]|nr:metallophosphoesterase family protein [Polyangia bacterium]
MRQLMFALSLCAAGCFFEKELPLSDGGAQNGDGLIDLHQGGSIALASCGYTVKTVDGASIPQPGANVLGADPAPKMVHLNFGAQDASRNIAVVWRTNDNATLATTVQFGTGGNTDKTQDGFTFVYDVAIGDPVRIHETHLCGLTPDTLYSYRVGGVGADGTQAFSPVYTFRTAPDRAASPSAEVVMLVLGDTRDGYSQWGAELTAAAAANSPDVILFSGDAISLGPVQEDWDTWFNAAESVLHSTPMIYAHGNHDVNSVNFFSQLAQPADEQNFYVDYGPVHLAVANDTPQVPSDLQGANTQLLDADLAAGAGAPWLMMMHHKPMWTAASGPHPEDQLPVRMAFQPVVDKYKVDLVLAGHDHDYERTKPMRGTVTGQTAADGTIYVVAGSAGAPLYPSGTNFWTATSESTFNYVVLRVHAGLLRATAFRGDGTMLDSFMIAK